MPLFDPADGLRIFRHQVVVRAGVHRDAALESELLAPDRLGGSVLDVLGFLGADRKHWHLVQRAVLNVVKFQNVLVDVVRSDFD